ncbi:hypothetical protein ABZ477_02340 [Microbacterium sp. NPDC019599]|uniref:hypothetical protein n=1 Tax=Microbacterium sp. NPDC019599 TaxID=3154690 RepID=UPI0033E416AC
MATSPASRTLRLRREAWGFMVGSAFFALGAVPWYASAVGPVWGSLTFFVGSIFFTFAGLIQLLLSGRRPPLRGASTADAFDWWAAAIQFVGTLLFNVSTFAVLLAAYRGLEDPAAGWTPDAWGSAAFLISSTLALFAAGRRHELWDPDARTWRGTWLNMAGSVAFGISAIGAYVVPATGDFVDVRWINLGTFLGAVCFFVAAALSRRGI